MSALIGQIGLMPKVRLWTPASLTVSPSIWLDEVSTLTNVSGAASLWTSRGSAAGSFGQSTVARRPTINATGLNGLRTLTFDGTDDYVGSGDTVLLDAFRSKSSAWALVVFKKNTLDGSLVNRNIFSNAPGNSGGGGRFSLGIGAANANRLYVYSERIDGAAGASLEATSALTTNWTMAYVDIDWSAKTARIYIDGQFNASSTSFGTTTGTTSNTTAFWPAAVGAFAGSTPVVFANVDVAAVLQGSNGIPSAGEIDKLFGYAAWHYGLAGNLPSGHAYKLAAPSA